MIDIFFAGAAVIGALLMIVFIVSILAELGARK